MKNHNTDKAVPQHIAIIMDGNGRWAKQKNLSRGEGHSKGLSSAQAVIEACARRGVNTLSLFAFGQDNWARPQEEVNHLMALFLLALEEDVVKLHDNNIRLKFIGKLDNLDKPLREGIVAAEQLTAKNTGLTVLIAINYSGQWDILQAIQKFACQVQAGELQPQAMTGALFNQYLCTANFPQPDLFIRTSGEQRLSNFFLWQLVYAELYFSDLAWPDFDVEALEKALQFYQSRTRRFGLIDEQLEDTIA